MNKVTIIPESGLVMIDGISFDGLNMAGIDPSIHAIQWYGGHGEIEYKSHAEVGAAGETVIAKPSNKSISSLDEFSNVIAEWEAAKFAADNPPKTTLSHSQVWDLIQSVRTQKQAGGFPITHDDGIYWFHSDEASRVQQLGLVQLGQGIPPDLWWKTMSGEFVVMTPELANKVLTSAMIQDTRIFSVAEVHKAEMEKLSDPTDYDYSTGWPQTYDETREINADGD